MDGNTTSYEVSDLTPCTTYTFSVSAMTEAGTGPPIIVSSTIPLTGEVLCVYMHNVLKSYTVDWDIFASKIFHLLNFHVV